MSKREDEPKRTSRRNFGKQLTGALAALPVASLAMSDTSSGQTKPIKSRGILDQRKEHDTPPPMLLMEGSLIIEVNTDRTDWTSYQTAGNRRKWLVTPKWTTIPRGIYIAHIKVVDGSGEMLFRFDNDMTNDYSTPIVVTASMKKGGNASGDCQVSVEGLDFSVNLPNTRKIDKRANNEPADEPLNLNRKRVRFMDNNRDDRHDFESLSIDKGPNNLYHVAFRDLPSKGKELKVMLWWEES
jgi:hypothetical protein